jgi:hypothetical protein
MGRTVGEEKPMFQVRIHGRGRQGVVTELFANDRFWRIVLQKSAA